MTHLFQIVIWEIGFLRVFACAAHCLSCFCFVAFFLSSQVLSPFLPLSLFFTSSLSSLIEYQITVQDKIEVTRWSSSYKLKGSHGSGFIFLLRQSKVCPRIGNLYQMLGSGLKQSD
ncbi:uncharacterized protein [Coffea arabica]|uniref:Uncharacterized protein n=1 Tax=Coffea arabica TaxID=13443 RepID=A0ABM4U5R2_COFAR